MKLLQFALLMTSVLLAQALFADDHRQVTGNVAAISAEYGNIDTDLAVSDLEPLELEQGDTFSVSFGDKTFAVYLGTTYSDVPRGDWVAFVTEMGNLRIARNFENAATTLGVEQGDAITLSH